MQPKTAKLVEEFELGWSKLYYSLNDMEKTLQTVLMQCDKAEIEQATALSAMIANVIMTKNIVGLAFEKPTIIN